MDSRKIRSTFLDYFAERSHKIVPSSSLVPDDRTLLLTNAGMVQFKPYFLGEKAIQFPRAATVQKCFREIDLEEVGKTARHLTFFEMLGNFSFGDYFKEDACLWAWELMTTGFRLDPDRLWVTVYENDDESAQIWKDKVGVPQDKILKRTRAEGNFWDMGVAGPCGPCSELLYDRGQAFGEAYVGGNLDEERYLEVWNLVFMQQLQDDRGEIVGDLPSKNVDTGMGLERLASILQGVPSNFEIDTLAPILKAAEQATGRRYGAEPASDIGLRVLTEHARAMTFLVAEGVFPGNLGRGYVLRRLIRRASRHARLLGVETPILGQLTKVAIGLFAETYPEVGKNRDLIDKVVSKEEAAFDTTLKQGLGMLEGEIKSLRSQGVSTLPGELVFRLHDTFGFPAELTEDIARDEALKVDHAEFERLMLEQRRRARTARQGAPKGAAQIPALSEVLSTQGRTEFCGYEQLVAEATVVAILTDGAPSEAIEQGAEADLILSETPFYAQGGGQVGDKGEIHAASGVFLVEDTRWAIPGIIGHRGRVISGGINLRQDASARVDSTHREGVTRSHTATHMLHWALRQTLGQHAKQQGSLVEAGRLRFDFSHFESIPAEDLELIEAEINRRVLWGNSVRAFETSFAHAQSLGAMALFGEKYGEHVRVVEVGDYSKELCGGIHVAQTGQIGVVKLIHEGSVAAGVRRVEALTGTAGLAHLNAHSEQLRRAADLLKTNPDLVVEKLEKTLEHAKSMEARLTELQQNQAKQEIRSIAESEAVRKIGPYNLVALRRESGSPAEARSLAGALRQSLGSGIVIVASADAGKANLVVAVSKDLVDKGLSAVDLLGAAKPLLGGGGGGKPDLAVSGGPNHDQLDKALLAAEAAAAAGLEATPG